MAAFAYRALGPGGEIVTGEIPAETREAAIGALRRRGVVPLSVEQGRRPAKRPSALSGIFARKTATEKDLMLFTREFGILLAAGLPIDRALAMLDRILVSGPMARVPGELLAAIRGGSSLGAAMAARPRVFPPFYVGMVRAGEAGGALVEVLERVGAMLERAEALKASIRSALTYPLLVLVLTGLSLVVLLVYVVPEFEPMLEDMDLPLSTEIVLAVSGAVTDWGWAMLAALLAGLLGVSRLRVSEAGRARLDRALLGLPLVGGLVARIETARFCRSLGTLRANGVPLVEAVGIAAGTLGNRAVADAARRTVGPLSRGEGLSGPMRRSGQFPDLALQLIEVGEESGRLQEMLLQVADVYDKEVERAVQRALALLAPAVTVLLGVLIAFIIGSILGAILGSYDLSI